MLCASPLTVLHVFATLETLKLSFLKAASLFVCQSKLWRPFVCYDKEYSFKIPFLVELNIVSITLIIIISAGRDIFHVVLI